MLYTDLRRPGRREWEIGVYHFVVDQLQAGTIDPDCLLPTSRGEPRRLAEALRDQPIVLVFYHEECPTCQFAMPYIQRIHARNQPSRAAIWGISQDSFAETSRCAESAGLEFEILIDEEPHAVSVLYELVFVPAIFIVGMDGIISWSDCGFSKHTFERIDATLSGESAAPPLSIFSPDDGVPTRRPGCRSKG